MVFMAGGGDSVRRRRILGKGGKGERDKLEKGIKKKGYGPYR